MSIHEGNANRRLASEASNISFISKEVIPEMYKANYLKLLNLLENTFSEIKFPLIPIRIKGIQNRTAAKYLKLLIDIEWKLREELNSD